MTTAELLARYAANRDAEAFALLVEDYQSMVFATCRRRVKEPGDVNDAVQETFLRLARSADALRSNVAAWLHRCAMNVSIDLNRRADTRRRHETAAVRAEEALPDAYQELADLREQLDAAINTLDEQSRELILQRFFVGRPQLELAAEAGVSPSAISQRLDRAIVALREHMVAHGGSALAAGNAAGLPALLTAEHASAQVPAALTGRLNAIGLSGAPAHVNASAAGVTTKSSASSVGIVALLILFATVILTVKMWPQLAVLYSTAPTTQPGPALGITVEAGSGESRGTPKWNAEPTSVAGVLAGRIADAAGKPVVGATITLNGEKDQAGEKTDAEGRYVFATIKADGEFRVGVKAKGFVTVQPFTDNQDFLLQLSANARAQRNWVLQRAIPVTVKIADKRGEPLKHLRLSSVRVGDSAMDEPAQVDADGVATVWLPPENEQFAIMARADGRAPMFTLVSPEDPANLNIAMTMQEGITVHGTAMCSDGKPATGWSVELTPAA